mmetsp:Transcript_34588/g.85767  ORF Transcript_34588/g.85767 Transcript_34588/m.85767 type:complete len:114 (-) Transcript_34588:1666-2007(-)
MDGWMDSVTYVCVCDKDRPKGEEGTSILFCFLATVSVRQTISKTHKRDRPQHTHQSTRGQTTTRQKGTPTERHTPHGGGSNRFPPHPHTHTHTEGRWGGREAAGQAVCVCMRV